MCVGYRAIGYLFVNHANAQMRNAQYEFAYEEPSFCTALSADLRFNGDVDILESTHGPRVGCRTGWRRIVYK